MFLITKSVFLLLCVGKILNAEVDMTNNDIEKHVQELLKLCPQHSSTFNDILHHEKISWDALSEFDSSPNTLGKGAFGKVKETCFPQDKIQNKKNTKIVLNSVAIKKVLLIQLSPIEIEILQKMSQKENMPVYLGCFIDKYFQFVYLVQEKLLDSMENETVIQNFLLLKKEFKLILYYQLFEQVFSLFELGFVNNDIKPANMMINKDQNRVYILDFGLGQKNDQRLHGSGSPAYMCPAKFNSKRTRNALIIDDLYSLVISILEIEAGGDLDAIFKDPNNRNVVLEKCGSNKFMKKCQDAIIFNANLILGRQGYVFVKDIKGFINKKDESKIDNLNFSTFLLQILKFNEFNFTKSEVLQFIKKRILITNKGLKSFDLPNLKISEKIVREMTCGLKIKGKDSMKVLNVI